MEQSSSLEANSRSVKRKGGDSEEHGKNDLNAGRKLQKDLEGGVIKGNRS
jgi:hypothetical protein